MDLELKVKVFLFADTDILARNLNAYEKFQPTGLVEVVVVVVIVWVVDVVVVELVVVVDAETLNLICRDVIPAPFAFCDADIE